MRKDRRRKNIIEKMLDELVFVISSFINNIFVMKPLEMLKYIFEVLVIILAIYLLKLPFDFIKEIGNTIIKYIVPLSKTMITIWSILVSALYAIIALCTFVVTYHKAFYQKFHLSVQKKDKYDELYGELYDGLIVLACIPLFIITFFIICALILSIDLNIRGINYYFTTIILSGLSISFILIIKLVIDYLKGKRMNNYLIKLIFGGSFLLVFIGIIFLIGEINTTKYYSNSVPNMDYSIRNQSLETYIDDKLLVVCEDCYKEYEVIVDNTLENKVIVEVSYYDDFVKAKFASDEEKITITGTNASLFNDAMKVTLINNLKNRQLFNYSLLFKKHLYIYINKNDQDKLTVKIK